MGVPAVLLCTFLLLSPESFNLALQENFKDLNGIIIAVNPQDGEMFAEVVHPDLTGTRFPPGSLIKVFTTIAALESRTVSENSLVYCKPSSPETPVDESCWFRPGHGQLNLVQALAYSCDRYFMKVAERTSFDEFMQVLRKFGLTDESDSFHDLSSARKAKIMVGLGTDLRVAPREILNAFCALCNGGYLFTDGAVKIEVSGDAVALIRRGMRESAMYGTSMLAQKSAGAKPTVSKTGTAAHIHDKAKTHAWYVGFYPDSEPELGILVFVEDGVGSKDAAGVGGRVFELYFRDDD